MGNAESVPGGFANFHKLVPDNPAASVTDAVTTTSVALPSPTSTLVALPTDAPVINLPTANPALIQELRSQGILADQDPNLSTNDQTQLKSEAMASLGKIYINSLLTIPPLMMEVIKNNTYYLTGYRNITREEAWYTPSNGTEFKSATDFPFIDSTYQGCEFICYMQKECEWFTYHGDKQPCRFFYQPLEDLEAVKEADSNGVVTGIKELKM